MYALKNERCCLQVVIKNAYYITIHISFGSLFQMSTMFLLLYENWFYFILR